MPSIVVMNPKKGKSPKAKKRGGQRMARRKKNQPVKYKYRKPSKKEIAKAARAMSRRAGARGKETIMGIEPGEALKGGFLAAIGVLATYFTTNAIDRHFGDEPTTVSGGKSTDDWSWKEYLLGPLGGFLAAIIYQAVFRGSKGKSKYILAGSLGVTMWQFWRNEIAKGTKLEEYFSGADDQSAWDGADQYGDIYDTGQGTPYVMGQDGWLPADDSHRLPPGAMADDVQQIAPQMGQSEYYGQPEYYGDDIQQVAPQMGMNEFDAAYGGWTAGF